MAAAFWPTQLALLGINPPTEVTQRLVLWLGFYDAGTTQLSLARTNLDLLATKSPPKNHRIPTFVPTGRTSELTAILNLGAQTWSPIPIH
jgi:hypothetical protein